jgi:hypothetical protein
MLDAPKSRLTHAQAERVGKRLCARWKAITGQMVPAMNDLTWADIVQYVERHSSLVLAEAARDAEAQTEGAEE